MSEAMIPVRSLGQRTDISIMYTALPMNLASEWHVAPHCEVAVATALTSTGGSHQFSCFIEPTGGRRRRIGFLGEVPDVPQIKLERDGLSTGGMARLSTGPMRPQRYHLTWSNGREEWAKEQ
jgi:hypothetical protein